MYFTCILLHVNTSVTFAQKCVFYLHKRNKCMNFIMYQNKMPLRIHLVMGGGTSDRVLLVRIPLPENQERAYLV